MSQLDNWLNSRLEETKRNALYRTLQMDNKSKQDSGKRQLVFSSNNYLGLATDERLIQAAESALVKCGVGSSGSRLTTGNSAWHEKLEKRIACFKQTEASLLFSSGYLANIGVLSSLPGEGDVILSDELNHASIIDGCRLSKAKTLIYKHVNMTDLEVKLQETRSYQHRFIVTDGIFSMDGTIAPLDKVMSLAKQYDAYVIVDDAHATGVLGENGRGTSEYFAVMPDVIIGTLSKAIGTEGGFVAGSKLLIEFLINHARTFIFQTAVPPSSCAASYAALAIIEQNQDMRRQLNSRIQKLKRSLSDMGYTLKGDETPIIPVIIGEAKKAVNFAKRLQEEGIYAPAIRPPTVPTGESRIRLTLTTDHTLEDIDYLLRIFELLRMEVS